MEKINKRNNGMQEIADKLSKILEKEIEWLERFNEYAENIKKYEIIITNFKKQFNKSQNLSLYTSIGDIKNGIQIRFKGQTIAYMKLNHGTVKLTTKKFDNTNQRDFGFTESLDCDWTSQEAKRFRKHFKNCDKTPQFPEHRFENMLIDEFSKTNSATKALCNIQPVKIYKKLAFQLMTTFSASKEDIKKGNGGIDILARVKQGKEHNLCVIELKQYVVTTQEFADDILKQGLAYAVFLRALLRSNIGKTWYEIFGYKRDLPDSLKINICLAAPKAQAKDKKKEIIPAIPAKVMLGNDVFTFKYLYFSYNHGAKDTVQDIETDLFSNE